MRVGVDIFAIRETRWYQYALRFLFGGVTTAVVGIIAMKFGPGVGGLFLAFPAILPCSVTLIEKHQRERKEQLGLHGSVRACRAASVDAAGASMGSIGLLAFAAVVWQLILRLPSAAVLILAIAAWFGISLLIWTLRKRIARFWRAIEKPVETGFRD